jgi:hypothetical protein
MYEWMGCYVLFEVTNYDTDTAVLRFLVGWVSSERRDRKSVNHYTAFSYAQRYDLEGIRGEDIFSASTYETAFMTALICAAFKLLLHPRIDALPRDTQDRSRYMDWRLGWRGDFLPPLVQEKQQQDLQAHPHSTVSSNQNF